MKKILKRFFYFLTGFIAILVSLNLYLEVVGVPNRIKNDLLKDLSNEDVTIHAERMYASIFSGVILDNATITAPLFGEKPLIKYVSLKFGYLPKFLAEIPK